LELGIAEHCNLACRSCSHVSPVLPKRYMDPEALSDELKILSRAYHAHVVSLLGGEPLLHPNLLEIMAAIRESGVGDRIAVATNGVLLPRMKRDFWQAVDWVEVSRYPGKSLTPDQERECRRSAVASRTGIRFCQRREFREAYSEPGAQDAGLARAIFDSCEIVHVWRCHTLAAGRFFKCPQSYYLSHIIPAVARHVTRDSVLIRDTPSFGEELRAYLGSTTPLGACGHCLGTAGRRFAHGQVPRRQFRELQTLSAEELVDPNRLLKKFPVG
jgi:organic radical activating enzyme